MKVLDIYNNIIALVLGKDSSTLFSFVKKNVFSF